MLSLEQVGDGITFLGCVFEGKFLPCLQLWFKHCLSKMNLLSYSCKWYQNPADGVSCSRVGWTHLGKWVVLALDVVQHFSCWMWATRKKAEMQGILGSQVVGDRALATVTEKAENVRGMRRIRGSVLAWFSIDCWFSCGNIKEIGWDLIGRWQGWIKDRWQVNFCTYVCEGGRNIFF